MDVLGRVALALANKNRERRGFAPIAELSADPAASGVFYEDARAAIEAMRGGVSADLARKVYNDPEARRRFISLYNAADVQSMQESAMVTFIDAVLRAALSD